MKKILVLLAALAAVLLLVVGGLLLFAYRNLDEIVRRGTEAALVSTLDVPATVAGANVDLRAQKVEITGILIPNPEGFDSAHAVRIDRLAVQVDAQSFRTDTPVIKLIEVDRPNVIVEARGQRTNLQELMDRAGASAEEEPADDEEAMQLLIERLVIASPRVQVAVPMAGGRTAGVTLPTIERENIGGQDESVSPAEALEEFFALILAGVSDSAGLLASQVRDLGEGAIEAFGDALGGVGGELGRVLEGGTNIIGGAAAEAGEALGGAAGTARDAAGSAVGGIREGVGGILGRRGSSAEEPEDD